MKVPKKPYISDDDITLNFDKIYTNLEIDTTEKATDLTLLNQVSALFEEFEK